MTSGYQYAIKGNVQEVLEEKATATHIEYKYTLGNASNMKQMVMYIFIILGDSANIVL